MAYLLGALFGGLIAIYLLAVLWEWALFKRVLDDPLKGTLLSVTAGWLTSGTLAGFGMADGGTFQWAAFLAYAPAALIIGFFAYRRGQSLREHLTLDEAGKTFA
jgi:hypothetical protein